MKRSDVNTVTQERSSESKEKSELEYLNSFCYKNLQKILADKFVFDYGLRKLIFQDLIVEPRDWKKTIFSL